MYLVTASPNRFKLFLDIAKKVVAVVLLVLVAVSTNSGSGGFSTV